MPDNTDYCPNTPNHEHSWTYIKHIKGYTLAKCSECFVMHKIAPEKELPLIPTGINNHFLVLVTVYNAERWIEQCVNSILSQTYKNYTLLVIDDCSTDDTAFIIKSLKIPYIINKKHEGKMSNLVKGWKQISTSPEDILVEVDGDDWFSDNDVLAYLNSVYQDKNIWFTYGQFRGLARGGYTSLSQPCYDTKNYRENYIAGRWRISALRTYKMKVLNKIRDEDFRDNYGKYYTRSSDVAMVLPTLELCGVKRIKCIDRVLYVYNNLNPINDSKVSATEQLSIADEIKHKPRYDEIDNSIVASVLIPSFKRPQLLKWGLFSLSNQQTPYNFEVIVLNDGIEDETKAVCDSFRDKLNIKYIFTGQRNDKQDHWRVPGFAINIGAKHALGKVIIIMCPEIFILDNCLTEMITPLLEYKKLITITNGQWDGHNIFLPYVEKTQGIIDKESPYNKLNHPLRTELPFFIGINKEEFISIGGYDEDFIGVAFDDDDLIDRLKADDCDYHKTNSRIVHLYHPSTELRIDRDPVIEGGFKINQNLYSKRKGIIVRNKNREWGLFDSEIIRPKWYLKKIPKIAHFYWGNSEMPFLRFLTIYSFHKFNPDWEIRLYKSVAPCKVQTWEGEENKHIFIGGDYTYMLKYIPITYITFNFNDIGRDNDISEVFKSEIMKCHLLATVGGLWSDMDIIYFKPMTNMDINKEKSKNADTIISLHPIYKHSIGFLLSAGNNRYYEYLLNKQKKVFNSKNYQSLGVDMISKEFPDVCTIERKFKTLKIEDMSVKTIYAYDALNIDSIYESNDMSKYDKDSIALHWYGGYPLAGKYLNELTLTNYMNYDNVLGLTIRKLYEGI